MTTLRLALCAIVGLTVAAGSARAQIITQAQAGFNDASGINSNPTPNSPYNVANTLLVGQGVGEPGWATPWLVGNAPRVVNSGQFEGDGALSMQANTDTAFRGLTVPLSAITSVQVLVNFPTAAQTGIGLTLYVKQFSNNVDGPQWFASTSGQIFVVDGIENGSAPLLNTGFTWTPGQYQSYRMDINTTTRTWEFFFNGVRFNSPTPLGYRGAPVFLDRIQLLNEINAPGSVLIDSVFVGVPEPSSLALLGTASAGLAYWRRRRKSAD